MRRPRMVGFFMVLAGATALAQEGFPLDGTWHGAWEPSANDSTAVVLVMKWDGNNINGTINPGPNSVPFTTASLNPDGWTVHIEAQDRDAAGNPVEIIIDGRLDDIGSYNRTLAGTWRQGAVQGEFKITRD